MWLFGQVLPWLWIKDQHILHSPERLWRAGEGEGKLIKRDRGERGGRREKEEGARGKEREREERKNTERKLENEGRKGRIG